MKKLLLGLAVCASLGGLVACSETPEGAGDAPADAGEVNLYSSRHYDTDLALYEDFTQETGIKVNRIEADADALIERIRSEGEFSPGDILITVDAGRLWRAEEAGVFAPVRFGCAERTHPPRTLRHPDGLWTGLSTPRARIIIYNKAAGTPEGLENLRRFLARSQVQGRHSAIRSSSNILQHLAAFQPSSRTGARRRPRRGPRVGGRQFSRARRRAMTPRRSSPSPAGECRISVSTPIYLARYARGR